MKNLFVYILLLANIQSAVIAQVLFVNAYPEIRNQPFSDKMATLQATLDQLANNSIPGVVAGIWDESGYWSLSSGFAKIENQTPMKPGHLQYLQSISKTYLAVNILQLYEEGKLDLEDTITKYLPSLLAQSIPNSENITIRMLLNHTSGIPEYNTEPTYVTRLLQNPKRIFQPEEYLEYIEKKMPDFEPGSGYSYRNSNYLILALIADQITGNHQTYMEDKIFDVLGLKNTFYRIGQGETYEDRLVDSYWDRFSDGVLENVSILQNSNVVSMIGDDGIITTPEEAIIFLKGIMEGKLISKKSLELMQDWVMNQDGKPVYGLGLNTGEFQGVQGIGHSGGGLGAGCQLYYFPEKDVYIFLAINLGTVTQSPLHKNVEKVLEEIYQVLLH